MRLFLITAFLLVNSWCFSQYKNIYFLKNNGEYVQARDSADYIRIVSEPDSGSALYNISEYYMNGVKKQTVKASNIDPFVFEGEYITYFKSGKRKSVGHYYNGADEKDEYDFYPNGKLYRQIRFPYINLGNSQNYLIIAENDSLGNALVTNGNGYYIGYEDDFKIINEQGKVKKGLRDSIWAGCDTSIHIKFVENYVNGELQAGISIDTLGNIVNYSIARETGPKCNGDENDFFDFLRRKLQKTGYLNDEKIEVAFIVGEDGKLSNFKVTNHHFTENLDKAIVNVILQKKRWTPAIIYGRATRSYVFMSSPFMKDN